MGVFACYKFKAAPLILLQGHEKDTGITITAQAGMGSGTAYANITANDPYLLEGWANKYTVVVTGNRAVTVTAKVTDYYGNPVANKWVGFIPYAQSGTSTVNPTSGYTDANGLLNTWFTASNKAGWNYVGITSTALQGVTLAITGTNGNANAINILPRPMSLGAMKSGLININGWRTADALNAAYPSGHENIYVSSSSANVRFSYDNGNTWVPNLTIRANDSGGITLNVRSSTVGSNIIITAHDVNSPPIVVSDGTTTLNVTEGLFLRMSPASTTYADAGSYVTITAQIVDQSGNTRNFPNVSVKFATNYGYVFPPEGVTNANGSLTAGLTLSIVSGLHHIVTDTMTSPDDVSSTADIISQPVTSFAVSAPSSAYNGIPVYVTVRAKDPYGVTVSDYTARCI